MTHKKGITILKCMKAKKLKKIKIKITTKNQRLAH